MIHSMTGFGEASLQVQNVHYSLEIRSLNNRYFKAIFRLPEAISGLEAELEQSLRKRINRGSLTVTVRMRTSAAMSVPQIQDDALVTYLNHLEAIHQRFANNGQPVHIDLTALLAMPGVLQPTEEMEHLTEQARPALLELQDKACDRMVAMRKTEGAVLERDLLTQSGIIREHLRGVIERAPLVVREYHQRLHSRIQELLASSQLRVNETDVIREVAVFAEKADITEETSRLAAHLQQLEHLVGSSSDQPVGRTLDFLAQEMLREANTMASKCNDAGISRAVVEIKGAIDRIKEQAANVE